MRILLVALLAVLVVPTLGFGELLYSISTGYDNATATVIAGGAADPDYTINPGGIGATVLPEAFPIPPWIANSATSKWIGFNNAGSNTAPGDYEFTTTVNLGAINPAATALSGVWSTDNLGSDIIVNGVSTGATTDGNFGVLQSFGPLFGLLQPGANTVTFKFNNAPPGDNPAGLRVDAGVYSVGIPASFDLPIYNTGVDNAGVPLADNAIDPHWKLAGTGAAAGVGPDALVARGSGGFPIGPWLGDGVDVGSAWIVPTVDTNGPGADDAIYEYSTSFTTPMAGKVTIAGRQSVDNEVTGVLLDGVAGTFTSVGFSDWGPFSVTADVTGTQHELKLLVRNLAPPGPTGLRVSIGSVDYVPVPEPSSVVLLVSGLAGAVFCRRRRK